MDCARRKTESQEPPVHAFPLTGPLPAELDPPPGLGPVRRWWWGLWSRRANRRYGLDSATGPLTRMLNIWLAETLDQDGSAFRIVITQPSPDDAEQRRREAEERYKAHFLERRRAMMEYMPSWQHMMADRRTMEVWLQSASGDWTKQHDLLFAEEVIRDIMSLAPNSTCILTRNDDQPALHVTVRRLQGELEGLEVSWEEMPASSPATPD